MDWNEVIKQVDLGITTDFAPIGSPTVLEDNYKRIAARVRQLPHGGGVHMIYAGHPGQTFSTSRQNVTTSTM